MTHEPVRIVADDRERNGGVVGELTRLEAAVLVRRLEVGDYAVEDRFVVERKTLRDFAVSVIDARWFRQTAALANLRQHPVIVLEGTMTTKSLGVSREALQGALITASVFYGVPVLRAYDATETARLLCYLGRQARHFARGTLPRPGYRPKGKRARQRFVLQGLPGIGPERAEKLMDHFGSVEAVMNASAEALAAIEGIGEATAAKIRWIAS